MKIATKGDVEKGTEKWTAIEMGRQHLNGHKRMPKCDGHIHWHLMKTKLDGFVPTHFILSSYFRK